LTAVHRFPGAKSAWRIDRVDAIDSTNEEARRLALAGDPGRLWIVAAEQTAGRGRRGRAWVSRRGNLYATALLIDPCAPAVAPELGFVAGVALACAANDVGAEAVGLKWPNDLIVRDAKCAGVLVEAARLGGGRTAYAIGVGVNCAHAPEGLAYPTARLSGAGGAAVAPSALLDRLVARFDETLALWNAGDGFAAIRAAWLERAQGLGQRIEVDRSGAKREGLFEGIDAKGRLLLRSDRGVETIEAADLRIAPEAQGVAAGPAALVVKV
jgi:BirA family biotin operon repressor/biotin-[acetyl-CoA-carboxylase] ligase